MRGKQKVSLAVLVAAAALLGTAGCHVNKHKNGDKENVDISTPFGGMKVDTNKTASADDAGFSAYPGATPDPDKSDKNHDNADVDMHFGDFRLRVKVISLVSNDPSDHVQSFYQEDLTKRYGDYIVCKGKDPVGTKTVTSQGLTCDSAKNKNNTKVIHLSVNENALELRSGSKQHQHVVSIEPKGSGTKFALIAVDLPGSGNDEGN